MTCKNNSFRLLLFYTFQRFFFHPAFADVLPLESEWQQVFSSHLDSSQYLNNSVVSTRPLISKSSFPFIIPLMVVPRKSIIIGISSHLCPHRFFSSLARSTNLSLFSLFFNFTVTGRQNSLFSRFFSLFFFVFDYYYIWSFGQK